MEKVNENVMLPVGKTLQMGKYRVVKQLAAGGFGNTYMVMNTQFEEHRAMKEFFMKGINERDSNNTTVSVSNATNSGQFDAQREKFKKEARRLRRFNNANIVGVDDLFDENGTSYYVMDFVEGGSVSELIKRNGVLSEQRVLELLPPLLDALDYIHSQQMWHLDLKPGNILLGKNGEPMLIDFGASKQLGKHNGEATSTAMTYTPGYAPPEQIDQNFERIGAWTDLYALGGTIYNMLTGKVPPSVSEIQEGEEDAFEFSASVSGKMRRLIRQLMNPNRRKRLQSVADVRALLAQKDEPKPVASDVKDATVLPSARNAVEPTPVGKAVETGIGDDAEESFLGRNKWQVMAAIAVVAFVVFLTLFRGSTSNDLTAADSTVVADHWVKELQVACSLGVCTYTGDIDHDSLPHGKGEAKFANGYYKGPFEHGRMEGDSALFRYNNGDEFTGRMHNDKFAKGRYVMADGNFFVGTFRNGQPETGTWYGKNGKPL